MIEFDYDLDYKNLDFKPNDTRYRIGRGEQGVLLVRPYTDDICYYWKFKTPNIAEKSSRQIWYGYFKYWRWSICSCPSSNNSRKN